MLYLLIWLAIYLMIWDGEPILTLSDRQLAVLDMIANGMTRFEIARRLDTSEGNVRYHMMEIYKKLGARNNAHAVAIAYRQGLL